MIAAYIRVSTHKQDYRSQRFSIAKYAKNLGGVDVWESDVMSGTKSPNSKNLHKLLDSMKEGDTLIVSEVSRIGRSTLDVMSLFHDLLKRKISVHCIKNNLVFNSGGAMDTLLVAMFATFAQMERELISVRTKEALAMKKAQGQVLGREVGSSPKMKKLERKKERIEEMLEAGSTHEEIALEMKVSRKTLYKYLKDERTTE